MTPKQIKTLEAIIGKLERLQNETKDFKVRDLLGIAKKSAICALNETSL
jgi:DNA polymerase/3'-5' exonuclease PolX